MLTQKRLKDVLDYNPATGIFIWKKRLQNNAPKVGHIAGHIDKSTGYRTISIDAQKYYASRLAWLYMKGYFPEYVVDHRNRIRSDDTWINLRHITHACNLKNCKLNKKNKSGITGVHWSIAKKRWIAQLVINFKQVYLGSSKNIIDAVKYRFIGELKYGFLNCNKKSTAYLYLLNNGISKEEIEDLTDKMIGFA